MKAEDLSALSEKSARARESLIDDFYDERYKEKDRMLQDFLLGPARDDDAYRYFQKERVSTAESGFTLMELLIVLALVAVISMIAVPIYRSYVQSAKITEGLTLASSIQLDTEIYYTLNNKWPSHDRAHADLKIGDATDYQGNSVQSISVSHNVITVLYDPDEVVGESGEGDVQLILTAEVAENSGVIRWECRGRNMAESDLPANCQKEGE